MTIFRITLLLSLISSALAEVKIHSSIADKSFYVGEAFTYEILIDGAEKVTPDEVPESSELHIKFLEMTRGREGSATSIALRYKIAPIQPGYIVLPIFMLEADGEQMMTEEEQSINVGKPEALPGLVLTRKTPDSPVYIGQPFHVDYQWQSPLPLIGFRAIDFTLPLFHSSEFSVRSPHAWIDANDKSAIGLPASNYRLIARHSFKENGELFFNYVSFTKILMAKSAGEKTLHSATLLTSYVDPPDHKKRTRGWKTNYPSYFNNNFFDTPEGTIYQKFFVSSPTQKLQVLPLPEAGKPHDFLGQVGARKISVSATPEIVAVGDPITLTIEIDDCDFPEVLEFPDLDKQLAFTRQFAIPSKQSLGRIEGKKITYIRTIRAKAQDVSAIPAIRLPYFDPITKSYGVAESQPIPITVKAAEVATAYDAQISGAGPIRNQLEPNKQGIRANITSLDALSGSAQSKTRWWILSSVLPPLGFVCFFLVTRNQRLAIRNPAKARSNKAYSHFLKTIDGTKNLRGKDQLDQINHCVRTYFADKLNLTAMAHTYDDLETRINNDVKPPELEKLATLYQSCEDPHYRAQINRPSDTDILAATKSLISTIEKAFKV